MKEPSLSIVIPCYNEEKGIKNLYYQLSPAIKLLKKERDVELILVDDGSTDNTNVLLNEYFGNLAFVKILKHKKNQNIGAAIRTGIKNSSCDLISFLDSDCTYSPKILVELLILLKNQKADIVVASPYHPKGKVENVTPLRLFLSKSISFIYKILTNSDINTFTSLVRIYRKDIIKKIKFKDNGFIAVTKILIYPLLDNRVVVEYPTTLKSREYGVSKMKLINIIINHLEFILELITLKFGVKS